jgi:hypothetical protein
MARYLCRKWSNEDSVNRHNSQLRCLGGAKKVHLVAFWAVEQRLRSRLSCFAGSVDHARASTTQEADPSPEQRVMLGAEHLHAEEPVPRRSPSLQHYGAVELPQESHQETQSPSIGNESEQYPRTLPAVQPVQRSQSPATLQQDDTSAPKVCTAST